jgi:hypothetical protein
MTSKKQILKAFHAEALNDLKSIKTKLDPRTYAAYEYKITNPDIRLSSLKKFMSVFQNIKLTNVSKSKKITLKDVKAVAKENKEAAEQILNISGYNPSEQKQKLTRDERINSKVDDKIKKDEELIKSRYSKQALGDKFNQITLTDPKFSSEGNYNPNVMKSAIIKELLFALKNSNFQYNIVANLIIAFKMINAVEGYTSQFYYNSKIATQLQSQNQIIEFTISEILKFDLRIDALSAMGSGFTFEKIDYILVQFSKTKKTKAGSYIETPKILANKKAIVNIKNNDDKCIIWALLTFLHYDKVKDGCKSKLSSYEQYISSIKTPIDIKYPIDIQTDIKKFERLNNIKINVFEYDEKDFEFKNIKPLYNTSIRNDNVCNLLLLKEGLKEHLVLIRDFGKLKRTNDVHEKRFWCYQCLECSYDTTEKLISHQKLCFNHEAVGVKIPKKYDPLNIEYDHNGREKKRNDLIKFTNHNKKFKHPFGVYLDIRKS